MKPNPRNCRFGKTNIQKAALMKPQLLVGLDALRDHSNVNVNGYAQVCHSLLVLRRLRAMRGAMQN